MDEVEELIKTGQLTDGRGLEIISPRPIIVGRQEHIDMTPSRLAVLDRFEEECMGGGDPGGRF
jgi:hypothetical protein